jgi:hypothetical protein
MAHVAQLTLRESIDLEQFAYGMKMKIMILKCTQTLHWVVRKQVIAKFDPYAY